MELHKITTGDGFEYVLNPKNSTLKILLSVTPANWGLPPITFVDEKAYRQHGVTQVDYFLEPRTFSLNIQGKGCTRSELWQLRQNLLDATRPNRGLLTYTFTRADGQQFNLLGRALSPNFPETPSDQWDEFAYVDALTIEAIDPVWYQGVETCNATATGATDLVFPITFPIVFGDTDAWGRCDLSSSYLGTWFSYPTIIATGAFSRFSATNLATGKSITYLGSAVTGQTVTIKLANTYTSTGVPVGVTVTDSINGDRYGLLSPTSDLDMFRIEPKGTPQNIIVFSAPNSDGSTNFQLQYNQRFIGI